MCLASEQFGGGKDAFHPRPFSLDVDIHSKGTEGKSRRTGFASATFACRSSLSGHY